MTGRVQRAVTVIGSGRPEGTSTSEALAHALHDRLGLFGVASSQHPVTRIYRLGPSFDRFVEELDRADLLVLSTPIYVDSLPYPVTALLELLHQRLVGTSTSLRMVAIANCGFPEQDHTSVGLAIAHTFARQTGLRWLGGLGLGAGEVLHGAPLEERHRLTRHVGEALDLAAAAIACGDPIPARANEILARPLLSPPVYRWTSDAGWIVRAIQNHAFTRLWAKPFRPVDDG